MPQMVPTDTGVDNPAKANAPTDVPAAANDILAAAAALRGGLTPAAGAWPSTTVARFTVACADCHREVTRWAVSWQDAAWWLRKAGWHARGHGQWRCSRCCAHARRPRGGRR